MGSFISAYSNRAHDMVSLLSELDAPAYPCQQLEKNNIKDI